MPRWANYVLILLLQAKVIWRIWDLRDITYGDTSGYFLAAKRWTDAFQVEIAWSPLYTAFYGSFLFVTSDPYAATILHRVTIVLLASAGVLFVLRRLLPSAWALLGAAWWAVLPINYDTTYEVHLFALLPILLAWGLVLGWNRPWARGAAAATMAASIVLVRNEFLIAWLTMLALGLGYDLWRREKARILLVSYGAPFLCAAVLCGLAYWRSVMKFPALTGYLHDKHAVNMCQVYAFGFQQRHPEWTASPWTGCEPLAQETFGRAFPTFAQMLSANPSAVFDHMLWNLRLVPNGLQELLFSAIPGGPSPDYVPVSIAWYPPWLGVLVILVIAGGLLDVYRDWGGARVWVRQRRLALIAFLPLLVMAVPVVLVQRPRPSYFFYVSVIVIACTMAATHLMSWRWPIAERVTKTIAPLAVAALIAWLPIYHVTPPYPQGRPVAKKIERVRPHQALLAATQGRILLGHGGPETVAYLGLRLSSGGPLGGAAVVLGGDVTQAWDVSQPIAEFLERQGITLAYLDPHVVARLRSAANGLAFLENPRSAGWRMLGAEDRGDQSWMILVREK